MNLSELEYLCSESAQREINQYKDCDPIKVAMNKHIKHPALIATQIKYLQRARIKLPSYYAAECIIPERGFEQCSSELCASVKELSGDLCIDLTCGLGVDTLHFSSRFKRVIALERDPVMAQLARVNFKRLGVNNIEVINRMTEDVEICGNQMLLYSIFCNLIDNAIAYSGGRRVFVDLVNVDDTHYHFLVRDNGIGVESRHLTHLFERFYRVDKGRSRKAGGTGLGLSIVKNAVLFHGGQIEARAARGGGLEFYFSLKKVSGDALETL